MRSINPAGMSLPGTSKLSSRRNNFPRAGFEFQGDPTIDVAVRLEGVQAT